MSDRLAPGRSLRSRIAVSALAVLCAGSGVAWGQQQEVDFRASVDLVLLHVAVVDPRGGDIPPLTVDDFTIYDDDVEQDIELFVTPRDAPLDVAMVLDSSGSMKPVEMAARRAAITFLNKMGPNDCIYVLPFSDTPGVGRWGRAGDPELRAFISDIRAVGGTALYDAVLDGLAELERADANELVELANEADKGSGAVVTEQVEVSTEDGRVEGPAEGATALPEPQQGAPRVVLPPRKTSLLNQVDEAIRTFDFSTPPVLRGCGEPLPAGTPTNATNARRKALIVLSDGADIDSKAGFYDALGAARAASVPVFPVAMGYANSDPSLREHLGELARATGGRMIASTQPGALASSYDEVVQLLRSYYLLGYEPDVDATSPASRRPRWHDVRVDLRRPNFEPLVRPGYYR